MSNNLHSHKYSWRSWNRMSFFLSNWILPLFSWRRFLYTIASTLEQKTFKRFLFFFCGNLVFRLVRLYQYQIYIPAFFFISAGMTAFRRKIAAVNLNSQQKFYDNGASAVLRRLTAVSAELPAILEK